MRRSGDELIPMLIPDSSHPYPRKPFNARGSKVTRCQRCCLPETSCICAALKQADSMADFWLLMHHNEFYKPSNTGRIICHTFPDTGVSEWQRLAMSPAFEDTLIKRRSSACIVFPAEADYQHRMIECPSELPDRPLFIIPDGTWRQARRIFRHSEYLQDLPVIEPKALAKSSYFLRKADIDHHLCTAEVAIALLEQMGDQQASDALMHNFNLFNQKYYAAKGRSMQTKSSPPAAE